MHSPVDYLQAPDLMLVVLSHSTHNVLHSCVYFQIWLQTKSCPKHYTKPI